MIKKRSKILIISHVGRPKGKINEDLSLKPICENLEKKINKKIKMINDDIFKLKKEDLFKDPNDQIVFVGVASEHRLEAFQAAQFLMDYLKTRATFWKKIEADGQSHWAEAKVSDNVAAAKWEG